MNSHDDLPEEEFDDELNEELDDELADEEADEEEMTEEDILELTQQLLDAIASANWPTYQQLCHPDLTAFEPEARGHLVTGMKFHRFYFQQKVYGEVAMTITSPRVWLAGDAAVIAYVRVNQFVAPDGSVSSTAHEETRVWQKMDDQWKHVHFHRSAN